ncbi:AAA family ATPase [Congregibacter variabilis]|uniref:AAA family ATPase n=1 Tax=Congregibacter variabilis TaxID=3081200 RepID=A0ABZ0I3Z2_9GAMM|nr:AAA family ATPase [Congregibacter sp. IMCC43200]
MQNPRFSFYKTLKDKKPLREITPGDLREMARNPKPVSAKEQAPLFTPYAAPGKTKAVAEQAPFWLLVLDHDDDGRDLSAMRALYDLLACGYLVYSTAHHYREKGDKPAAPRWRVVIQLSRSMGADEWLPLQKSLAKALGADCAATQLQHGFYAPALVGIEPRYEFIDELARSALDPGDAESPLRKLIQAVKPQESVPFSSVQVEQVPLKPRNLLTLNNGDLFDKIAQHYRLHTLLTEAGYKPTGGNKYLAPNSSTGTAGVALMTDESGTERVFSHHGEHDPLSHLRHGGHALDAFDVLTELRYNGNEQEAMRREAETVDPDGQRQRQRDYMREQEPAAPQTKLSRVDLKADWDIPAEPTEYVLEALIPARTLTILGADGGKGKTALALAIAAHAATGRPWAGLNVSSGQVAFVSLEDEPKLIRTRLKLACIDYNLPSDTVLKNLHLLDGTDGDGALIVPGSTRQELPRLTATYDEICAQCAGFALIVIDNASDAYAANEIDRREVRTFTRALVRLARETGAAVLLLNHVDKTAAKGNSQGASYSGSTAWNSGPRSRLALLDDHSQLVLRHEKHNLGPRHDDIAIRFSDYGTPLPDLGRQSEQHPDPSDLLPAFRAAEQAGISVNASLSKNQYSAQTILGRLPECPEFYKRGKAGHEAAASAIIDLKRQGLLVEETYRDGNRRQKARLILKEHAAGALSDSGAQWESEKDDSEAA